MGSIALGHDDFVHDVQYDFYGNQLATCSSDQKIKIWQKVALQNSGANNGEDDPSYKWECKQILAQGHTGAVWRITWADPEYGENGILASCGYDKQVIIWSETETQKQNQSLP